MIIGGGLLESAGHEKPAIAAPDQGGETSLGHQSRRADVSEWTVGRLVAALHKCDEAIARENEMRRDFGWDEFDSRGGQFFKLAVHIL